MDEAECQKKLDDYATKAACLFIMGFFAGLALGVILGIIIP
jgi:hypothetical protein